MLRLSLETRPDARPAALCGRGAAIGWFEDALSPLAPDLGSEAVHRLAIAVRSAVGIESLVWLLDVAGLSREDAVTLMQASAVAILRHALPPRN